MKVTTIDPERKPDIRIEISWEEAAILTEIVGGTTTLGQGHDRTFVHGLYDALSARGLVTHVRFSGKFTK
jgi:hypothetical protein